MAMSIEERIATKAMSVVKRTGRITRGALAGAAGCEPVMAGKVLRALVDNGALDRNGERRGTFYTPTDDE